MSDSIHERTGTSAYQSLSVTAYYHWFPSLPKSIYHHYLEYIRLPDYFLLISSKKKFAGSFETPTNYLINEIVF